MLSTIIFWGLCAVLVLIPLPSGGDVPWAVFAFEGAVFALAVLHVLDRNVASKARFPFILKFFVGVFLAVTALQLIPLPPAVLKALSPRTASLYHDMGAGGWRSLSLAPALSFSELVHFLSYGVFAFLVYRHVRTRRRLETFTLTLLAVGVFESFYGLAELFVGSRGIFGFRGDFHLGWATGTFLNHDHFAGLLEMLFALALGYLLANADRERGLREKILWFAHKRLQRALLCGIVAVVIGLGIVFSRSRSGIFIFFVTIVLAAAAASADGQARRFARILWTVAVMVVFAAVAVGVKPVFERFTKESMNMARDLRFGIYANTLKYIRAFPAGTGLRTFAQVYPMFETRYEPDLLDHAHNDYLEVLAESGAVGGGALILFAATGVGWVFLRWLRTRDPLARGIALGALLGVVALLLHSFTYFNLRNPANAVYFVALFALAAGAVEVRE
ncbi:MAG TPA: O-antigen ligase family protein [Acidobacteriota bacterium]|nr:O-antigen ligase family protein [Acidobacteriota bacterium]